MKYCIIFALFCAFCAWAGPAIIDRIIFNTPYKQEIKREIFNDLRELRISSRLSEFNRDVRLDCAAQSHADDIAARSMCVAVGANGETPRRRVTECGITDFSEVVELVACNGPWSLVSMLKSLPENPYILKMREWRYIGIGVRENYYVIYLIY